MTTQYWLVKSEPGTYSWADLVRDQRTAWTGVRNYAARLHLRAMRTGDEVCFYHSGAEKCVVGIARVTRPAFPDPTGEATEGWVAVELAGVKPLTRPVTLARIKSDATLRQMELVRQSRLSVSPVRPAEFALIKRLGGG
jgi:predicted RNA-binding protein with PUA-like domain